MIVDLCIIIYITEILLLSLGEFIYKYLIELSIFNPQKKGINIKKDNISMSVYLITSMVIKPNSLKV